MGRKFVFLAAAAVFTCAAIVIIVGVISSAPAKDQPQIALATGVAAGLAILIAVFTIGAARR